MTPTPPPPDELEELLARADEFVNEHAIVRRRGEEMVSKASMERLVSEIAAALRRERERLDHLEQLIRHCPHAEFYWTDDEHEEKPLGFSIEVVGCETTLAVGTTFREAIDADRQALTQTHAAEE